MIKYKENFDELQIFGAYLGEPLIDNTNLIIPILNLGVSEHPINQSTELKFIDKCYLLFENVKKSERTVMDYDNNGDFVKPGYAIIDIDSDEHANVSEYFLDGPNGNMKYYNIEWMIKAKSFSLLTLENSKLSDKPWHIYGNNITLDLNEGLTFLSDQTIISQL